MRSSYIERSILFSVLALLIGVGLWMQLGLQAQKRTSNTIVTQHQPDYFVEKFVAGGNDGSGISYSLRGTHLEHFGDDGTVHIDQPCLLLIEKGVSSQLVFADVGKVAENRTMIVLSGNVAVLEYPVANTNESVFLYRNLLSDSCLPPEAQDGRWTRSNELVLQLKSSPKV